MSDQDNLRDRIADLLWRTEEKSWEDQAQAVIDELGLTVETGQFGVAMKRVVGKWKRNE